MAKAVKVLARPWQPAPADDTVTAAVKAIFVGRASAGQQQRFINWLMFDVCEISREQFYAGIEGQRATDYALGKRKVALEIVRVRDIKIIHRDTGGDIPIAKEPEEPPDEPPDGPGPADTPR